MKLLLSIGIVLGMVAGFLWVVWCIYCAVLQNVWPDGPQSIINPGYWIFVGAWFLLGFIGKALFNGSKS